LVSFQEVITAGLDMHDIKPYENNISGTL